MAKEFHTGIEVVGSFIAHTGFARFIGGSFPRIQLEITDPADDDASFRFISPHDDEGAVIRYVGNGGSNQLQFEIGDAEQATPLSLTANGATVNGDLSVNGGVEVDGLLEVHDSTESELQMYSGATHVGSIFGTSADNIVISNEAGGAIYFRPNGRSSDVRELFWNGASDTPQFRDAGGVRDMWHAGNLPIEVKYFSHSGATGGTGVVNVDWATPFNVSYAYWLSVRVQGFRSNGTTSYRWVRTGLAIQTGGAASQGEYTEIADAGYGSGDTVFLSTSIVSGPNIRFQIKGDGSLLTPLTYNVNAVLFGIKVA